MTDDVAPRFSSWFSRWWLALLGAVVAVGGGVLWLLTRVGASAASFGWFAYQPLPRRYLTYDESTSFAAAYSYNPLWQVIHLAGAVLFIAGLVAVALVVGYRVGRARS
ncbi:hypothetical protein [Gryllotalpicola protaetiae]|uniref:Uncharacterized protein n=1 Tax=Gryllotalpicola protaetiae TaxID=2419771 RepID=A0A387BM08_9MICO|nr:hypothetical protein [Gryllotalpicola protaetiae]AYG03688.1 hypothetical protein D7I44_09175 [Gryllotalpicola protaetiae]